MDDMETLERNLTLSLRDAPYAIDAGQTFTIGVDVVIASLAEIPALAVEVLDETGHLQGAAQLKPAEEQPEILTARKLGLTAPAKVGPHVWTLRVTSQNDEAAISETTTFAFTTHTHQIAPVVWDIPPAMQPRETFRLKVGARCSSDCASHGWTATLVDQDGRAVASGQTRKTAWKGTQGLYFTELEATAPETTGLFSWTATVTCDGPLPHEVGRRRFGLRTTQPADAELRVTAVNSETGAPISSMRVTAHPFHGWTDAEGQARLAVPKGSHRVFVSGKGYVPFQVSCTVEDSFPITAKLDPDRGLTDADMWA